jgi:hypothetical protein
MHHFLNHRTSRPFVVGGQVHSFCYKRQAQAFFLLVFWIIPQLIAQSFRFAQQVADQIADGLVICGGERPPGKQLPPDGSPGLGSCCVAFT